MKIVLDTNVFIAAALKGGFSEDIIKMAANKQILLLCSEDILEELREKLRTKFGWSEKDTMFFVNTIKEAAEVIQIKQKSHIVTRDPDDNKVLECAQSGNADLIVSSDQDLIRLKKFGKAAIIHPKTLHWIFPDYFKKQSSEKE